MRIMASGTLKWPPRIQGLDEALASHHPVCMGNHGNPFLSFFLAIENGHPILQMFRRSEIICIPTLPQNGYRSVEMTLLAYIQPAFQGQMGRIDDGQVGRPFRWIRDQTGLHVWRSRAMTAFASDSAWHAVILA